jgi:hypothetical protein
MLKSRARACLASYSIYEEMVLGLLDKDVSNISSYTHIKFSSPLPMLVAKEASYEQYLYGSRS